MKQNQYIGKLFFLSLLLSLILCSSISAQQSQADSLMRLIVSLDGTRRVDALNELADTYQYINTKKAIEYASQGLELANKINYQKGIAANLSSLGFCYVNLDNQKAVEYIKKGLQIRKRINDKAGIATSLNLMGVVSFYAGDYLSAVDYHHQALKLREEIGDETKIATSYNNIALVHISLGNYETALDYLNKALKIRIQTGNKKGMGIIKDNIGDIYNKMHKYDVALKYFTEALVINREIGNKKSEANSCFNIAVTYRMLKDYRKSFDYLGLSLGIYKDLDEKNGIANVENGIALIYQEMGQGDKAIEHALIAYGYASEINSKDNISNAANILQDSYGKAGDYKNAYKFSVIYQNSLNILKNIKKIKQLTRAEYEYKLDKMKREQEAEISRQRTFIQLLVITLSLSVIIILLIILGYRTKKRTNVQLNEFNLKLKEVNATKDRFYSIIAHDLRGPFQSLLGISEILASDIDNLEKEEIVKLGTGLNDSLHKQYGLLDDLLEWSRLQNGNFNLKYESLELREIVDEVAAPLQLTISNKDLRFQNNVSPKIMVRADNQMMQLVLRNLISNSIKFTPAGGFISVSVLEMENNTEVTVTDNGVGISDKDLNKLFKIDIHHSTKGTADELGTGLGLILCKEIVEKHKGKIRVESRLGNGSSFIFSIPND